MGVSMKRKCHPNKNAVVNHRKLGVTPASDRKENLYEFEHHQGHLFTTTPVAKDFRCVVKENT